MAEKEPRISWRIEEYPHREKSPDWYWALGVIAVAGATIAVIAHNILFAIFILLGAFILGYYANREPELVDIAVADTGISVRKTFYSFEKIQGFSMDTHDYFGSHLLIETSGAFIPVISIPLPDSLNTEALAELLKTKIPEKKLKEPVSHKIMEMLGF